MPLISDACAVYCVLLYSLFCDFFVNLLMLMLMLFNNRIFGLPLFLGVPSKVP